jgi:hypothetical protein
VLAGASEVAKKEIVVPLNLHDALELARDALKSANLRLIDVRIIQGEVRGRTGVSLKSFGSSIQVTAIEGNDGTALAVTVKPSAALIDWGRSDEEVRAVISEIRRLLGER